jgi:predicted ATP-grasp superfamily ATP-dependent carboligase
MLSSGLPPVLLTMPTFDGTLAAVRCLGERGIRITIAGETSLAPAGWSRYVSRRVRCPSLLQPARFLDWLVAFGKAEPGHVLYPSCDDLAWLFAHHADTLGQYFRLYQPPAASLLQLLDKKALSLRCGELGIPSPRTVFPRNTQEAVALSAEVGFPLLIKPRTQMFLPTRNKGQIVESESALASSHARYVAENATHPLARPMLPDLDQPMLQAWVPTAADSTYSIAGFIGRDGEGMAVRAAVKVLQRPRRVGVGVCFEEAEVDPEALAGITRLCERVGYFGIFEAEFVRCDGTLQLVDFNPRFYGQMGFESARNLHLPYLAWLGSIGESGKLAEALAVAHDWQSGTGYVYCNRFFLDTMLVLQGLSGRMSQEERNSWREWLGKSAKRSRAFDPVESPGDPLPGLAAKVGEICAAVRHPRSFYRKVVIGSTVLGLSGGTDFLSRF